VSPRARKRFGQHFLEPVWAAKVLAAISPAPTDSFLEIGPGRGALTRPLVAAAAGVLAIEIDHDLAGLLRRDAPPGLSVLDADFVALTTEALEEAIDSAGLARPVRVAGNLPYNVAAPILFRLRDHQAAGLALADATVMLQREVADRLTARPGTADFGILTVLIGYRADLRRLLELPPGAFRPAPKVRSTVVRLMFRPPPVAAADEGRFERLVKGVFSRRRKTLANALAGVVGGAADAVRLLSLLGLDGRRRPETLGIGELVALANAWGGVAAAPLPSRGGAVL
jgi:16S rRNA (adenine1518-N6/adenine1519-N6)-dimethyltransferase